MPTGYKNKVWSCSFTDGVSGPYIWILDVYIQIAEFSL